MSERGHGCNANPPVGGDASSSLRLSRGSMMSQGAALCTGGPIFASVCYLDADAIPRGSDESIVLLGRYDDELVKDAGRW